MKQRNKFVKIEEDQLLLDQKFPTVKKQLDTE